MVQVYIVSQSSQHIVVNKIHWYMFFRGFCSGNVLFASHCPGYKHILLHLSDDTTRDVPLPKISKPTAPDNVYRWTTWLVYFGRERALSNMFSVSLCGGNDLSLARTEVNGSGITASNTQEPTTTTQPIMQHTLPLRCPLPYWDTRRCSPPSRYAMRPYCYSSRSIMHSFHIGDHKMKIWHCCDTKYFFA